MKASHIFFLLFLQVTFASIPQSQIEEWFSLLEIPETDANINRITELMGVVPVNVSKPSGSGLALAARAGNFNIVQVLANNPLIDVFVSGFERKTALHEAAYGGNLQMVQFLASLQEGALIESKDIYGKTALHWAAQRGHLQVFAYLASLKDGKLMTINDDRGSTVLHHAACGGNLQIFEHVASFREGELLYLTDKDGQNALHYALMNQNHNLEIVKFLASLQSGRLLNAPSSQGITPLINAVSSDESKDFSTVRELIRLGANPNVGRVGKLISIAAHAYKFDMLIFLYQHIIANVNSENLYELICVPFMLDSIRDQVDGFQIFIRIINDLKVRGILALSTIVGKDGSSYIECILTRFDEQQLSLVLIELLVITPSAIPITYQLYPELVEKLVHAARLRGHAGWYYEALRVLQQLRTPLIAMTHLEYN